MVIDSVLMGSHVFALGETHLEQGETVTLPGFKEYFASHGKGKGVSVFSRMECVNRPVVNEVSSPIFSAIHYRSVKFDTIFLYWSSNCTSEETCEILGLLESWILDERPTAIIGDFNIKFSEDNKINRTMEKSGFQQLLH